MLNKQKFLDIWESHMQSEFVTKDVDETMATMIEGAHVYNVPTMTGGEGLAAVREFYAESFISQLPPDTETELVSRTIDDKQIVDELVFKFTHTVPMPWMLPGIAPTGRRVEVGLVVVIGFRNDKISHEHIYWDQASVLVQIGLLNPATLPIHGIESARALITRSKSNH